MVNILAVILFGFVVACASPGWTHGGNDHVMGVVTAIDGTHLEVKTSQGAVVSIVLTDKTEYVSRNTPPTPKPRVGDRAVVDVVKDGKALRAVEIGFSTPSEKAKSQK